MNKLIRIPGAGHAITVERNTNSVVVTVAGKVIADSARALVMREESHRPVFYIPRRDVDMARLRRSDHTSYCPYKGDAAYFSIPLGGARSVNAAWTYETPHPAVAAIAGYLAFYPHRVDSIIEWPDEWGLPLPGHDLALGPMEHAG